MLHRRRGIDPILLGSDRLFVGPGNWDGPTLGFFNDLCGTRFPFTRGRSYKLLSPMLAADGPFCRTKTLAGQEDEGLEQLHVSDYQGDGPSVQIPLSYKPTQNTDFVRQAHCTLLLTQGSPGLPTGRSQRKDVSGLLETEGVAKEC